jgi:CDP-paratose 2-epimerase
LKTIITGGAGFIGCNAAARFLARGDEVVLVDTLARRGADKNWAWLQAEQQRNNRPASALTLAQVDVRDAEGMQHVFKEHADAEVVLHLAAQVAVTTSIVDPRNDFEINALGTFNVLEAARTLPKMRALITASTNKVYGGMEDVAVVERNGRYAYGALPNGVPETQQLDFHSPYGCSKGTADQYTVDYARIYDLPTVTFRQSCIYGPRQMGVEDQGWVAWFCIALVTGKPITIYGDGMQVRDVLHVDDLIDAYEHAIDCIGTAKGQAFNVGGGPDNVLSILETAQHIAKRLGIDFQPKFEEWRAGDQRVFIADISKAKRELGWQPKIGAHEGVDRLADWVAANKDLFE